MSTANPKPSRVVTVQVPGGEQPKPAAAPEPVKADPGAEPQPEASFARTPSVDLDAMRAQIRDEERFNARAELGQQIQAATTAIATPAPARNKADYRNMRAADIDPASLAAPVMTLDGYLCPPAPEKK